MSAVSRGWRRGGAFGSRADEAVQRGEIDDELTADPAPDPAPDPCTQEPAPRAPALEPPPSARPAALPKDVRGVEPVPVALFLLS